MKFILYTSFLFILSIHTTSAQLGMLDLDTLLKYHPERKGIDLQIQKKAFAANDSLKKFAEKFQTHVTDKVYEDFTPARAKIVQQELETMQTQIQQYHDSTIEAIDEFQSIQLDRLHQLILKEARQFANIHSLTYLISHKNILYADQHVKDYTNDLLVFLELKYRYRLTDSRLVQKKNSIPPAK